MPLEVQIIRASEFVRLDAHELLDFQASRKALYVIAHACRKRGIDHAVLDLRALPIPAKPVFSRDELSALVECFHDAGFSRQQRLAVLYRLDPHQGIRKFAFIGTIHGWQVRAFSDFEKALAWLSEDDVGEPKAAARQIPIRNVRRKLQVH
jgi:hypothetical protein